MVLVHIPVSNWADHTDLTEGLSKHCRLSASHLDNTDLAQTAIASLLSSVTVLSVCLTKLVASPS